MEETKAKATVEILRTATGEKRKYETDVFFAGSDHFYHEVGEFMDFIWTEGNYACDCNRAIFFAKDGEDDECPCGDTEYKILRILPK